MKLFYYFGYMNLWRKLLLALLCFTFIAACTPRKKNVVDKSLKANNYNFAHWKRFYHRGLYFYLPDYFERDYNSYYLLKQNGLALSCPEVSLYASVERYDEDEAEDFQFESSDTLSLLEAVHSNFVRTRLKSLYENKVSISKDMPHGSALYGYYHVLEGTNYEDGAANMYFIATVEKNVGKAKKYFVVQLICSKELATYLADDFRKMLKKLK